MNAAYLSLLAIIIGPLGGLATFLLMRRSKLREINTTTDATYVTTATKLVETLQTQIDRLTVANVRQEEERSAERTNFLHQLNIAHEENVRSNTALARLQTDLDIAQRQITELRKYLPDNTQMFFDEASGPQ